MGHRLPQAHKKELKLFDGFGVDQRIYISAATELPSSVLNLSLVLPFITLTNSFYFNPTFSY